MDDRETVDKKYLISLMAYLKIPQSCGVISINLEDLSLVLDLLSVENAWWLTDDVAWDFSMWPFRFLQLAFGSLLGGEFVDFVPSSHFMLFSFWLANIKLLQHCYREYASNHKYEGGNLVNCTQQKLSPDDTVTFSGYTCIKKNSGYHVLWPPKIARHTELE